jgi:hypothetical protein
MWRTNVPVIDVELAGTFFADDLFQANQERLEGHTEQPGTQDVTLMEAFS